MRWWGPALAVAIGALAFLGGCAGTPDELPPGERPLVSEAPGSEPRTTDDPLQFGFDRRGMAEEIVMIEVAAYEGGGDSLPDAEPVRRWELTPDSQSPLRVTVPLDGLEDGVSYELEFTLVDAQGLRAGAVNRWPLVLALGLVRPAIQEELVTLDRRQPLQWRFPEEADGASSDYGSAAVVRTETDASGKNEWPVPTASGPWVPEQPLVDAGAFSRRSVVAWQVRVVSARGVLGPWSPEGLVRFDPDRAVPVPRAHTGGGEAIVATPGLSWEPTAGAVAYRVELTAEDQQEPEIRETELPRLRLGPEELEMLLAGADTRTIRWRVVAIGPEGVETPFSDRFAFRYAPLLGGLETVVPVSARVTVLLGSEDAPQADERPAVAVALPLPFEMSRYPMTNRIVAALVELEVAAGRWEVTEGEVRTRAESPRVLIGLGELDFGAQFGLRAENERLSVVEGYAAHPAVGLTWHGALAIANALSLLEARAPVYEGVSSADDEITVQPERDGYRLPTEAEWAAAGAARQRIVAGTELTLVEDRTLSSIELRGVNYLRSGDRWDDPRPPYTRNGGPTAPVGSVGGGSPVGISDLLGNVWEWTADWYDPEWYRRIADGAAQEPWAGPREPVPDVYGRRLRTVRGMAWNTPRDEIRPGNRGGFAPASTSHSIGVRLVRSLPVGDGLLQPQTLP